MRARNVLFRLPSRSVARFPWRILTRTGFPSGEKNVRRLKKVVSDRLRPFLAKIPEGTRAFQATSPHARARRGQPWLAGRADGHPEEDGGALAGCALHLQRATGQVADANVVEDKYSGQSRGFGFVDMPDAEEARTAISRFHGHSHDGRPLTVNEAKPREDGGGSRGGGGYGGGRSSSGGGGNRW